jgi:hypothetical protein
MTRLSALVLAVAVLTAGTAAFAQERTGRYTMSPVEGGFLRLDTETGALALCTRRAETWSCEPVNDSAPPKPAEGPRVQMPSEPEIDRAIDELERLFKKYRERLRDFDRNLADPTQPPRPQPRTSPAEPKSL